MIPKKTLVATVSVLSIALSPLRSALAAGNGTAAGLTLVEAPSARAYALGESMVAATNDVSAFAYNPASLGTLSTGQASFLYQKGLIDDAFGQFMIGRPSKRGGLGLSVGYYDGGNLELSDGVTSRTVAAQRDLTVALGLAGRNGRWGWGMTGKYLSSELVERARARTYAADLGLTFAASPRLRIGGSVQNVGPELRYVEEGDDLPRMARLGAAWARPGRLLSSTLFVEGAYAINERDVRPSLGLEVALGVMAMRAGARRVNGEVEVTAGAGFLMGGTSVDYSVGMAREVDTTHRISYSFRFGNASALAPAPALVRASGEVRPPMAAPEEEGSADEKPVARPLVAKTTAPARPRLAPRGPVRAVYRIDKVASVRRVPKTYTVRAGDTLASIAKFHYGDYRLWKRIYGANKHLLPDPRSVEIGQKLVLP